MCKTKYKSRLFSSKEEEEEMYMIPQSSQCFNQIVYRTSNIPFPIFFSL
jgi:hypothetical protein